MCRKPELSGRAGPEARRRGSPSHRRARCGIVNANAALLPQLWTVWIRRRCDLNCANEQVELMAASSSFMRLEKPDFLPYMMRDD
jgi:hypothetical protein